MGNEKSAGITIRLLEENEINDALDLAWKVFNEYEAPDYTDEGTEEFKRCLHDEKYLAGMRYYGAFDHETLAGILGIRERKRHVCFFFVDGEYHRRGIGTKLFRRLTEDFPGERITLNSSPYGLPFYRKLGLKPLGEEQTIHGIRFTPMEFPGKVKGIRKMIAYCGLDCGKCDAYIATKNNDDELRAKTAKLWSELNFADITADMINCEGCRMDGVKTPYCEALCPIRQCAEEKGYETCGSCPALMTCEKAGMIIGHDPDALKNLTGE